MSGPGGSPLLTTCPRLGPFDIGGRAFSAGWHWQKDQPGTAHKGHSRCVAAQKHAQAIWRNERTKARNRSAKTRAKREKGTPPAAESAALAPVVGCPWPWKDKHPDKSAASYQLSWLRRNVGGDWKTAQVYRCPALDGHWHIGNPAVPAEPSRRERKERERYAA